MGGQSKLQLGAFTIFPAFGIILPNGHQTITVDCVAEQQGRFDEVSHLSYEKYFIFTRKRCYILDCKFDKWNDGSSMSSQTE